ncbi:slc30 [Acrasis kona]|uniref:Slc30 n=2 Tax=Acrasis kona TaxID=1008807 RepID=A0AAW2YSQ1_9EUKA
MQSPLQGIAMINWSREQVANETRIMIVAKDIQLYSLCTSMLIVTVCFLSSIFVLFHLTKKRRESRRKLQIKAESLLENEDPLLRTLDDDTHPVRYMSKSMMFSRLTQYCILCMIVSDLLFDIFFFFTQLLRLLQTLDERGFVEINRELFRKVVIKSSRILSELAESFVISSGIWTLLISICILKTIKNIHELKNSPRTRTSDMLYKTRNIMSETLLQQQEQEQYFNMRMLKRRYKLVFTLVAFVIPLGFALVWTVLEYLLLPTSDTLSGLNPFLANIIPDMAKNITYVSIEVSNVVVRIMVFVCTTKIFENTVILQNTPKAIHKRQKKNKLLRQLTLYCLPFFVFGIWLLVYRIIGDIDMIDSVYRFGFIKFKQYGEVELFLMAVHWILTPLRTLANALVYGVLTKWFRTKFNCCVSVDVEERRSLIE